MSAENFDRSLKFTLIQEGNYSDDKGDPGGKTMWGITHMEYDAYRQRKGLPTQDVRQLTVEERDDIYRNQYWNACRCDELPSGVDLAVWDCAVNCGVTQAAKFLQRSLSVPADGHIGIITLEAAQKSSPVLLVHDFCERRREFYRMLSTFSRFGKGWLRRTDECEALAKQMVGVIPHVATSSDDGASIKASADDLAKPTASPQQSVSITTGAGIGSVIAQQAQAIAPLKDLSKIALYIFLALTIAGVLYTFWSFYKQNQHQAVL